MSKTELISNQKEENLIRETIGESSCCGSASQVIQVQQAGSIRDEVQKYYANRAQNSDSCCGDASQNLLYESELLTDLPDDVAEFSLGCGDPITLAELQSGEVVLDLGSGGGLDCFLAARQVGEDGYVIGLDMTQEMLERATGAAQRMGFENVEFRQGFLEEMPVEADTVDVIVSNCVINLSPDKPKVFAEMFRTLKPGGRVSVSDIVTTGELPENVRKDMVAWGACIAGALQVDEYIQGLEDVGFEDVTVTAKTGEGELLDDIPQIGLFSASITGRKPVSPEAR
ncbi:MAG: arsenite methyltransferase [Anaerolineales bacterium]